MKLMKGTSGLLTDSDTYPGLGKGPSDVLDGHMIKKVVPILFKI